MACWRQAIIWTNTDLIHWRIYAALGGDEFRCFVHSYAERITENRKSSDDTSVTKPPAEPLFFKGESRIEDFPFNINVFGRVINHSAMFIQTGNSFKSGDLYMWQWTPTVSALVQVMACCLFGTLPLLETKPTCCRLGPYGQTSKKLHSKYNRFI